MAIQNLHIIETKAKAKSETSGNKTLALSNMMQHLERTMIKANASYSEVMQFERDFLEMNGIAIPDSFMVNAKNSVDEFIEEMVVDNDNNISGSTFYFNYLTYCDKFGLKKIGKQDFFSYLRSKGMLAKRGTVEGKTVYNVILKKAIKE